MEWYSLFLVICICILLFTANRQYTMIREKTEFDKLNTHKFIYPMLKKNDTIQ